jgi:hypothetical protein
MSDELAIRQLKETAKWSNETDKKKTAIRELSARGEGALPALQEILNVTAYDEIKGACMDAIKAIKETESPMSMSSNVTVGNKKNKEQEDEEKGEVRLADLPP